MEEKRTKRILLVYPEIPYTYWGFNYALPFIHKKASMPPLGLLTIAAIFPDDWELTFVDMNVTELTDALITNSNIVFISAMLIQQASFSEVVERCNRLKVPIVAGGPYPTACYKTIIGVDHFVLGEAEITLPLFLKDLKNEHADHIYISKEKPDLINTPVPRYDLISLRDYATMPVQFSRGCPFNCEFCDIISLFGRKSRTKKPAQFIRELEKLHSLGWRGAIFVVDDNFIGHIEMVKKLLDEIIVWQKRHNYPFEFFTEASVNIAEDQDLLRLMPFAGFNMVFLGIETPDEETLRQAGKFQNLKGKSLHNKVMEVQKAGLEVTAGFILGSDTDKDNIFECMIKFIQNNGIPGAMVGLMLALPGTRLYNRLKAEGRLLKEPSGNNTHNLKLTFKPKMDPIKLINGYKQVIKEIYRPRSYFDRCLSFLENLQPQKNYVRKVRGEELYAFFISLIRQTFSFYGYDYIRFIIKSLLINPHLLPEAVVLAIKGHHFFKITREILKADKFNSWVAEEKEKYVQKINNIRGLYSHDAELMSKELRKFIINASRKLEKRYKEIDKDFRHSVKDARESLKEFLYRNLPQNQCPHVN